MSIRISQTKLILEHLLKGKSLTHIQAEKLFDCSRVGARIWDLRQLGYNIESPLIPIKTKRGIKHVSKYFMKGE